MTAALEFRRATKQFDPSIELPDTELDGIVAAAGLAPSSYNLQHWQVVAIREPARRVELAAAAFGQQSVADASCVLVLAADPDAWQLARERWDHLPAGKRDRLAANIEAFYAGAPQLARDEAMRSVSMFAMALMLVAAERGWQSCPYIGFDPAAVRAIAGFPPTWVVVLLVAIGHSAAAPTPRPPRRRVDGFLHRERWAPPDSAP